MGAALRNRVIRGQTPAGTGATYIPIDRYIDNIDAAFTANGTVTFTVDYTLDNIVRSQASSYDVVGNDDLIAPGSADWRNLIASGTVDVTFQGKRAAYALRINITAGTGSVSFLVAQNS